jgi:hypothetical protein
VIAIVTDRVDPHADRIIGLLRGHPVVRVNTSDLPLDTTLTVGLDSSGRRGTLVIEANGLVLDFADVTAVWWRRPGGFGLSVELSPLERAFAEAELRAAFEGLWAGVDAYWISRPDAIRAAGRKVEQLRRAARLGFAVPPTLVTTDPAAVAAFVAAHDTVVYKVLTDPHLGPAGMVRTTVVPAGSDLASVRNVPCLFQAYVPKRAEYRVTVIGDDVFVASVVAPGVDWREGPASWGPGRLPAAVLDRCVALVRSYGLEFSALDLIETPEGEHVFLENNPGGQFLFVQDHVPSLPLAEALAARLIAGHR